VDDDTGRRVVVTGGTGALGTAVVGRLLASGAAVTVPVYHDRELVHFPFADRVTLVHDADLTDEATVARVYGEATADGPLWASIQVAGGFTMGDLEHSTVADVQRMWSMNALSCWLCCREAVRRIGDAGGRLVNIAARPALVPTAGVSAYAMSKAAVAALTTSLAEELAPRGIFVNAVVPSIIDTPANRQAMPDAPHDRWPTPDELAATITFLASAANQATRGALVPVYGRS